MNRFLEKYRRGEKSLGTFTHLLSASAVEALARAGMDYVIIDIEHSPIGVEHAAELVGTADGAGLAPFVRVDEISRSPVLKMLDVGAAGLIVPQLETVEQAKRLVGWAKFAPTGNRGYCPSRDGGWGYDANYHGGMESYMDWADRNTLLIPQCETAGCLENIEEIVAIDGVDGIFIGPFDLSIALGIPGRFDDERHINAVERVRLACKKAGKPCIMFCGTAEAAAGYFKQGFDSVTLSLDIGILIEAVRTAVDTAFGK